MTEEPQKANESISDSKPDCKPDTKPDCKPDTKPAFKKPFKRPTPDDNHHISCLKMFIQRDVEVKDMFGDKHKGKLLSMNFMHLNVAIQSKDSLILIKNPQVIRLKL